MFLTIKISKYLSEITVNTKIKNQNIIDDYKFIFK